MYAFVNVLIAVVLILAFVVTVSGGAMITELSQYDLTAQIFVYSIASLVVASVALCLSITAL